METHSVCERHRESAKQEQGKKGMRLQAEISGAISRGSITGQNSLQGDVSGAQSSSLV